MNLLIFSAIYPAPAEYGIPSDTKVVHYFAKQWKNAGHNVQVVSLHMITVKKIINLNNLKKSNGFETDYEFEGIKVHLLEYQLLVPKTNYLAGFQQKNAQRRIMKFLENSFLPDKVFVHFPCSFKGVNCLRKFNCPTMAVLHNCDISVLKKDVKLVDELKQYQNVGGRNNSICKIASGILLRKIPRVLSGIDESLIPSIEMIEKKITQPEKPLKIVYAGNLIKLKKVDAIIKALQQISFDYHFDIIGDGPEKKKLMAIAGDNAKIVFRGKLSRESTIQKMRQADVFVMVSSPETFGLVYLEAMAQGCITVGSRNEGIDGVIIDGENGYLVDPGKVEELARCLVRIDAMNLEEKKKMAYSAYYSAADMTDFRMAAEYLQMNEI